MNEHPHMKQLGEAARDEAEAEVPEEFGTPFSAVELDAIAERVGERLAPATRARAIWFRAGASVLAATLAAAGALLFVRAGRDASAPPVYDLVVEGGDRATRGAEPAATSVLPVKRDGAIVLVARPRVPFPTAAAGLWVGPPGGPLTSWSVPTRRSEEGAFRLDLEPEVLAKLPVGASQLVVFIADSSHLPHEADAAGRALHGEVPGVQALVQPIVVKP